jgi:hypothetical protein
VARRRDEGAQRIKWREALGRRGFGDNFSIRREEKRSIAALQSRNKESVSIDM